MKKITLVILLLIGLGGCAFLNAQKANWQACQADPACVAQAKDWQEKVRDVSTPVAALVPLPGAAAAPPVFGYIAFALAMLIGGHKVFVKNQTTTPAPAV